MDNKFSGLLNPIRDLAKNWDIDVAASLEDYLDELSQVKFAGVPGAQDKGSLNFAEAALLIQGSATVYSRKVEYLYALVFQALQQITCQRGEKEKSALGAQASTDDSIVQWGLDDPEYLLLDDIDFSAGGTEIDMPDPPAGSAVPQLQRRLSNGGDKSRSHISTMLMQSIFLEDHGASGLKVTSCSLNDSGALLFAEKESNIIECHSAGVATAGPLSGATARDYGEENRGFCGNSDCGGDDWSQDYHFDGTEVCEDLDSGADSHNDVLSNSARVRGVPLATTSNTRKPALYNPLSLMDPYDEGPIKHKPGSSSTTVSLSKPLRVGRCFKLDTKGRSDTTAVRCNYEYASFLDRLCTSHKEEFFNPGTLPRRSVVGRGADFGWNAEVSPMHQSSPEFSIHGRLKMSGLVNSRVMSTVVAQQRREIFLSRVNGMGSDQMISDGPEKDPHLVDPLSIDDRTDPAEAYSDDFDDGGFGCDDNDNDPAVDYVDSPGHMVEQALRQNIATADESGGASFENLCKLHMDNFMQSAEAYARETQLSRRISDWVQKLEPLLVEQDSRRVYDISEYSDKVLCKASLCVMSNMGCGGEEIAAQKSTSNSVAPQLIGFNEIAQGESTHEVCRIFVACLQLANFGNISISGGDGLAGKSEGFQFSLLSETVNNDVENYRAPSVIIKS